MPFDPSVESIAALFTPLPIIWGFCGGWAIDLFLNRTTRPHKDVDIAILRGDQRVVFDFLRQKDWTLEQAVDGKLLTFPRDEFLLLPVHTIWCRNTLARPDFFFSFAKIFGRNASKCGKMVAFLANLRYTYLVRWKARRIDTPLEERRS